MPRYFFHVVDSRDIPDAEGTVLPDPAEARSEALVTAGEILRDVGMKGWTGTEWRLRVEDEAGQKLFTVRLSIDDHRPRR